MMWAERMDFIPTAEQVERGLADEAYYVRAVWGGRTDFTPTPGQIECGLADIHREIRDVWIEKLKLCSESILEDRDHESPICTI